MSEKKYFKFVSVEEAKTSEKTERPNETYYRCKVVEDTYAAEQDYLQKYGRKVTLSTGGTAINYMVFDSDPSFGLAKLAKERLAEAKDISDILVVGDVVEQKTARDYYILDNKGEIRMENGKPRVNDRLRFFVPAGASANTQFRSLQRLLKFVEITENAASEPDVLGDETALGEGPK